MKTTTVLLCLLMVAAPASAGGVVLVLPLDASLVDVEAPDNATVSSTVTAGHVVVTATGGQPGPVIVTGDLNGSAIVVAGFLPADAASPTDLAPLLARLELLEAVLAVHAENASQNAQNGLLAALGQHADTLSRFDALSGLLGAVNLRVADLQNGTATVSSQIADLGEDVQAVADKKAPRTGHGGVVFVLVVLLLAVAAQETRFWLLRLRGGAAQEYGDANDGLSFESAADLDPEE